VSGPIRILLQTTIPAIEDDWNIGRFSMLRAYLAGLNDGDGNPLFEVDARDRIAPGTPDPVLSALDHSAYDELWLFAVDVGDGLDERDCAGISRFREEGRGLLVARDHMDLGSSVCALGGIGAANYFHSKNPDPDPARHQIDDRETSAISWPNYHSGANGDWQAIEVMSPRHPVLSDPSGGLIRYLPAHPHEGGVGAPANDPTARVIATGRSKTTGTPFNIAVAFEASGARGPALVESTFHHFADYNWDPTKGCPSFVTERPGNGLAQLPEALHATQRYVRNLALWLAGRPLR
jgi:hypothetical protein